jgi:phage baseplate assembly protein W
MTDLPHFSYPFRFGGPQAAVTEQDSLEEIADCCTTILLCPLGYRVELPEFGLPPQVFSTPGPDRDEIRGALAQWEERAATLLSQDPQTADALLARLEVLVWVRTEE